MNARQTKIAKQAKSGFLCWKIQGDIAGLTTYTTRRGRAVVYLQAPPKEPVTPDQALFRSRFALAAAIWQTMSQPQREKWRLACKRAKLRLGPTALIAASTAPQNANNLATIQRQSNVTLFDTEGNYLL